MSRKRKVEPDTRTRQHRLDDCSKELAAVVVAILVKPGARPEPKRPDTPMQASFTTTARRLRAVTTARLMAAGLNHPNRNNADNNRNQ